MIEPRLPAPLSSLPERHGPHRRIGHPTRPSPCSCDAPYLWTGHETRGQFVGLAEAGVVQGRSKGAGVQSGTERAVQRPTSGYFTVTQVQGAWWLTFCEALPMSRPARPPRPREPITIIPAPVRCALSRIWVAGSPYSHSMVPGGLEVTS